MRENMTDLPDVARDGRRIGASITRGFCFICTRIYKYVVLLPISTASLLLFEVFINKSTGLSVIQKND